MESRYEKLLRLRELKQKYRDRKFKNIEDVYKDGIHINDYEIFPKNWYKIDNMDKQIMMIEKSLKEDIPIDDLPDMELVDRMVEIEKFEELNMEVEARLNSKK